MSYRHYHHRRDRRIYQTNSPMCEIQIDTVEYFGFKFDEPDPTEHDKFIDPFSPAEINKHTTKIKRNK